MMMRKALDSNYSAEHLIFLRKQKIEVFKIRFFQISILVSIIFLWEILAYFKLIDSFIMSSPSRIMKTIFNLYFNGQLWSNILYTTLETIIGFALGTLLGLFISTLIWWFPFSLKVGEPYLVILNALPKVALGPIIILWMGASMGSIIIMALLVSVVISIMNILSGFQSVNKNEILLMKSFNANKFQIFTKLVFPANISTIISTLKINVGMSLIGVITGEFLVSSSGIGYLIVYGGQVFKMDLVMSGILILLILAWVMYAGVLKIESSYMKRHKDK